MNKIKQTTLDKINGKLVKYSLGDCLSLDCGNGKYLGVFISNKFNKYYDITLIEYYREMKPELKDFLSGKFFGTRFGSWEELTYVLNVLMITCKYIDNSNSFELIGNIELTKTFIKDGYQYTDDKEELQKYYLEEISIRIAKSKNAENNPDLAFVSKHLIELEKIRTKKNTKVLNEKSKNEFWVKLKKMFS